MRIFTLTYPVCVFDTDPDHHEHHEHHNEDIQHLWDEWSEHGAYHDQNIAVNSVRSGSGCDKASSRFAALSVHIVSEDPPPPIPLGGIDFTAAHQAFGSGKGLD